MSPMAILTIIALMLIASCTMLIRVVQRQRDLIKSYGPIDDVAVEVHRKKMEAEGYASQAAATQRELADARQELDYLQGMITSVRDEAEIAEINLYDPMFDLEDPEAYQQTIRAFRESRRAMVKAKAAVVQHRTWLINGSKKEGDRQIKKVTRLALQAFHGETDTLTSKIRVANWERTLARVDKLHEQLNRTLETFSLELSTPYVEMTKREMRATFELALRRKAIKERESEMRAQMREEKRVKKELEAERKRLAEEEQRERQAIEQARAELAAAHEEQRDELMARLRELEAQLAETEERTRTLSMAEQTRVGHVYVVSNVGSFGQNVFKVGMTRRLEPHDRVKELSDASVPFPFDLHAMVHSDDAPTLEAELHRALDATRVNKVNFRKEFFRTSLDDIVNVIKRVHTDDDVDIVRVPPAEEFRQTMALLRAEAEAAGAQAAPLH